MILSIVIVNFNTKKLVLDCLKSINEEGSKLSPDVIVVDNGSSDGSVDAIRKLKMNNPLLGKNLKVKIIQNHENLGFARANNQGMKEAKGKYVLLLNSDTTVKRHSLGKLVDFAERTKEAGVVGLRLLNADGSIQPSCFHFPTITNAIKEYWFGEKGAFELYAPDVQVATDVEGVVGAGFLITPNALKKVGLLNEKYFMYFEDLDYCRRVWKKGLKVYYLPSAEVTHYHGASGKDIVKPAFQWRRLVPSSKIYHGLFGHYLINFILWSGQLWRKLLR